MLLGGHLVDRDAGVDVGAGGFLDPDAGQKCSRWPGHDRRARQARRSALIWSRPPRIWSCCLTFSSGCNVLFSSNSLPSFFGHQ